MVKKRGRSWQVDFRHAGKRIRRDFLTEHHASAWEKEAKQQLRGGVPLELVLAPEDSAAGWTMDRLRIATEERHWMGTANQANALRNARQVVEIIGKHKNPRDVTTDDVDRLIQELAAKQNSPSTINRKLAALTKMLRVAQRKGVIRQLPDIERKKEREGRLRWYTAAEEAKILKAAGEGDFNDLVIFLLDTGCRLTEACTIEWRDVDDVHARFHKRKGGRSGAVPLTQRLRMMLARRRPSEARPTDRVFAGWDRFKADREWRKVRSAAGLAGDDGACLHAFRHTCASRLIQAGLPILLVQQWLGHATLEMTMRYAHLAPTNWTNAVKTLERLQEPAADGHSDQRTG